MARRPLDRDTIEAAFRIMGERLRERRRFAEICLFGGSALIFLFEWRTTSQDVDVVIRSEHGEVIAARNEAARQLGLETSWLNEGVTQYVATLDDSAFHEVGVFPTYELPALRVMCAEPSYILAMKILAMGERSTLDDRDFQDAAGVAAALGLTRPEELVATVRRFFPTQTIPTMASARLSEVVAEAARRSGAVR